MNSKLQCIYKETGALSSNGGKEIQVQEMMASNEGGLGGEDEGRAPSTQKDSM